MGGACSTDVTDKCKRYFGWEIWRDETT